MHGHRKIRKVQNGPLPVIGGVINPIHQEFELSEMEVLHLKAIFGAGLPLHKPYPYGLYRWGFLYFRYLKLLVNKNWRAPPTPMPCQEIAGLIKAPHGWKIIIKQLRLIYGPFSGNCIHNINHISIGRTANIDAVGREPNVFQQVLECPIFL